MSMVRITAKLCARCKYRINVEQKASCNYLEITGHSKIFENGKLAYDPEYCDKYEEGDRAPKRDINLIQYEYDEYEMYKRQFASDTLGSQIRGIRKRGRTDDMYEG